MLSLLSISMVVLAATVDATPGRTKVKDGKPRSKLGKVYNHLVEAQSETFLAIATATGANTARTVLPYSPANNSCRGGEHTRVGYESSQVSCPFASRQEVMGKLQNGQVAALVGGLWLNRRAGPVAVPGGCEGLKVVSPNRVQSVDVESRVLKATVEADSHSRKTLSQELQRIYFTSLVAGGLSLPCGVIKAAGCCKNGVVPQRQAGADAMLSVAWNNGVTPALEMQPQEPSCPQEQ